MDAQIVFAAYKPHAGKREALRLLLQQHVPRLRELELVTERHTVVASAKDGTFIEVFEWRSAEAASRAHEHPAVAEIWESMAEVADFVTLAELEEAHGCFPHFAPEP